uniref:Uncharacterized protein n=1 Tax=Trypanosoma congolense (strain IL3000) TaxID=1068625 RepID=G0UMB4_TRYCI|nr:hypothetical protein, unlikely [Trypanosoma congolense IL3000]
MFRPTASGWGALSSFFSFFFSFLFFSFLFRSVPQYFSLPSSLSQCLSLCLHFPTLIALATAHTNTHANEIFWPFFFFFGHLQVRKRGEEGGGKQHKTGSKERSKFLTSTATCGGGQSVTHLHRVIYWGLSGHRHAGAAGMFSVL